MMAFPWYHPSPSTDAADAVNFGDWTTTAVFDLHQLTDTGPKTVRNPVRPITKLSSPIRVNSKFDVREGRGPARTRTP
ncbi:hypothetical protein EVAR_39447_1 [Eumeta japonica]|uniref:Uncharacterized protein n=1 Tax=Eumeta variegata TaxID=151549 RepID=A0A4C1W1S7_EUMVA|nr:hypothetical protein EVAR_39447_1 [Eumeta japonica]